MENNDYESIKMIINCWDPMDLLIHAPSDEYHSEIDDIFELLNTSKNITDLAEGIFQVFVRAFGENNFGKSKSDCAIIAQKIISDYNRGTIL